MSGLIKSEEIRRINYGYIVAPPGYPDAGQPLPVTGFVVPYPGGTLLFDTGMSAIDDETRERYHPRLQSPEDALGSVGLRVSDIDLIVNCHLHADHAGGNHRFPHVPVVVQRVELEAARQPDYTYPQYAFDYPGASLQVIDGEKEIAPGLRVIPTPGHTPGHQSLLIDTDRGRLLLAGQAANTTWAFSTGAFSERLSAAGLDQIGSHPDWMASLREHRVRRALFAHDLLVYEWDDSDLGHPRPI